MRNAEPCWLGTLGSMARFDDRNTLHIKRSRGSSVKGFLLLFEKADFRPVKQYMSLYRLIPDYVRSHHFLAYSNRTKFFNTNPNQSAFDRYLGQNFGRY